MENNKSVIILTNFWDANSLIDQGFLLHLYGEKELYKINIHSDKTNYSVHSIALSNPDLLKLSNLSSMTRLDVFCPTYDMLNKYKEDSNWDEYTKDYIDLLKTRKSKMAEWVGSLVGGNVYILCCWENTSGKAHCHREILYKIMSESKVVNNKSIVIYRNGNEIKRRSSKPLAKKDDIIDNTIFACDI